MQEKWATRPLELQPSKSTGETQSGRAISTSPLSSARRQRSLHLPERLHQWDTDRKRAELCLAERPSTLSVLAQAPWALLRRLGSGCPLAFPSFLLAWSWCTRVKSEARALPLLLSVYLVGCVVPLLQLQAGGRKVLGGRRSGRPGSHSFGTGPSLYRDDTLATKRLTAACWQPWIFRPSEIRTSD